MITVEGFLKVFDYLPYFGRGIIYTIFLAFVSVAAGLVLAFFLALMRLSKSKALNFLSGAYIEFVRGTPMLVQIYIIYYGVFGAISVPSVLIFGFIDTARFIPGVVAIALNSAGYVAEVVRGGIQGVDGGQTEAARSLGLSGSQNMKFVILPQAIKSILPAIANEFVTVIKESSICSVLGMQDIMYGAKIVQSVTWRTMEPLLFAAILYFLLTFPTSKAIQSIERRMRRGDER